MLSKDERAVWDELAHVEENYLWEPPRQEATSSFTYVSDPKQFLQLGTHVPGW
jgi:hypothetical protein